MSESDLEKFQLMKSILVTAKEFSLPSLAYSSSLKMDEAGSFKMLVPIYQTTQHYIPEDSNL
jgi:hypothetical protein